MSGEFISFVIDELRRLVSEFEGSKQPTNEELNNIIIPLLRKQYEEMIKWLHSH